MFEFVKQVFITLLNFAGSLFRKCVSLSNQETTRCMKRSALVGINSNKPLYYPFSVSFNKCGGCCDTINHPYALKFIWMHMNVKVFNLMLKVNESKFLVQKLLICILKQKWDHGKCLF